MEEVKRGRHALLADSAAVGYVGRCESAPRESEERTGETHELRREPSRGPWLLELGSADAAPPVPLQLGQRITFGTSRTAAIQLPDTAVSSLHCSVLGTEHGVLVEDIGSKNGLYVGSARVRSALLSGSSSYFVVGRTVVSLRSAAVDDANILEQALPGLVGNSAPMRRVAGDVRRHAKMRVPVLIQGESGTGKDVIARALHTLSRRSGQYLPLNVGALPESLADAELFGHRRGAFTGAVSSRTGAFEQAHKGTLFLDEIADLSPAVQIKLLRVVEDGQVRPVGGSEPISVDVRIVSASWASLPDRVAEGRFRADLYHRLSTVVIRLPPLRERKSDLSALAIALLARLQNEVGPRQLSSSALARLVAYDWPGNVRELMSVLYRAAVASSEPEIAAHHLDFGIAPRGHDKSANLTPEAARQLLARCGNNVSAAARAARVARSTFRSWLERASQP
jgi:transcriptional regulator with PAS, ATPase and Fis domain